MYKKPCPKRVAHNHFIQRAAFVKGCHVLMSHQVGRTRVIEVMPRFGLVEYSDMKKIVEEIEKGWVVRCANDLVKMCESHLGIRPSLTSSGIESCSIDMSDISIDISKEHWFQTWALKWIVRIL